MKIITDRLDEIIVLDRLCIALGSFDGIHHGHRKIIQHVVNTAREKGIKSAVLTFDRHPFTVLKPDQNIKLITDNNTKAGIIDSLGIDYLIFAKFDENFARIEPKDFIYLLKSNLNAETLVCGYNYTFGRFGKGNIQLLKKCSAIFGYELNVMDKVTYNNHMVSSTIIRKKIESGRINEANELLGYNLFSMGRVLRGKTLGTKLGFPTANIEIPDNLCLKNGVYITSTSFDSQRFNSISNVGYNPTVGSSARAVETHIIDYCGDLYGKQIKVEFLDFIREEKKFDSVEALKDRVLMDIESARKYFFSECLQ